MEQIEQPTPAEAAGGTAGRRGPLTWLVRGCAGAGALIAAWVCYGFGVQVSGVLLGMVAAINGAILGALIAGTLADQVVTRFTGS